METSNSSKIAAGPEMPNDFEWYCINGDEIQTQRQDFTYVLIKMYIQGILSHLAAERTKSLELNLRKNRKVKS